MLRRMAFLAVFVVLFGVGTAAAADRQFTPEQIRDFGLLPRGTEIPQLGDAYSRHYSNGDGSVRAVLDARSGSDEPGEPETDPTAVALANYSGWVESSPFQGWMFHDSTYNPWMQPFGVYVGYYNDYGLTWLEGGFIEWSIGSIPPGAVVDSVRCSTYVHALNYAGMTAIPLRHMRYRPSTYQDPNPLYNDIMDGDQYGSITNFSPGWRALKLTSQAGDTIASRRNNSVSWFAIGYGHAGSGNREVRFQGCGQPSPTLRPRLVVDYRASGTHDAGMLRILSPQALTDSGVAQAVQARVRNYGSFTETNVIARCSINATPAYVSSRVIGTLLAGDSATVQFDSWTPPRSGAFTQKCSTWLAGDANRTNDTMSRALSVRYKDVGCTQILAPTTADSGVTTPVWVRVQNYGTVSATFDIRFQIPAAGYDQLLPGQTLAAGVTNDFQLPDWVPQGRDSFAMQCFTLMTDDMYHRNDTARRQCFARATDVGCDRIIAPTGDLDSTGTLSPQAKVKNYGNTNVSSAFDVAFTIGGWSSTRSVASLNAGDSVTLTFDIPVPWNCPRGPYLARCSTRLSGDRAPENNRKTASGTVNVRDVGATAVVTPAGNVDVGVPVTPQVRAQNFGTADAVCDLRLLVVNAAQETLYDRTETGVPVPVAGPVVKDFAVQWTPLAPGLCSTRAFTILTGDANHANDSAHGSCLVLSTAVHDVSCTAIVAPAGSIDTLPKVPQARVKNTGDGVETFVAWFRILDPSSTPVYYDSARATGLAPDSEAVLSFPTWGGHHASGDYTTQCSTALAGDAHPENDAHEGSFRVGSLGPALWNRMTDLPTGGKGKNAKDGACLAAATESGSDTTYVYAFKGNNTFEFYRYNTVTNAWITRESIPAFNRLMKKKGVKKGASLVQSGNGRLYATKGSGTYDWWEFVPASGGQGAGVWVQRYDVPAGTRKVKEGVGAAAVTEGGVEYVYLLKGSGTWEFYRYRTDTDVWDTSLPLAPSGASGKTFKNGSCLTYDGGDTIYALKGSYNELFAYSISARVWMTRETLPRICPPGTAKKKVKDGAGIAAVGRSVYALKGGNTNEFWRYARDDRRWSPAEQMPAVTKKVKGGGALTYAPGALALYAFRGNNTREFWSYGPLAADGLRLTANSRPKNIQGNSSFVTRHPSLSVTPNPFTSSLNPSIAYSLPKSGNVRLRLFDISGKLVTTLASGYHAAGSYSSQLTANSSQQKLAAGIYVIRLDGDGYHAAEKLTIE